MAQDALSDGFVSLCISTDANWYAKGCRVLVEGQMTNDGIATPNAIMEITGTNEIEKRFGVGSVLSETLKTVFCARPTDITVFALPRLDADNGVKAQYSLTVTGSALTDGTAMLYWGNDSYNVDVKVYKGDTSADIAREIADNISPSFPFIATISDNVITLTAKNAGSVGNGLRAIYNWTDRVNIAPEGISLALEQTTIGSKNPAPSDYGALIGQCCYFAYILSSDDVKWQNNLAAHVKKAWDCSEPQCFGHAYVYNTGTLGQVLATSSNAAELSRLAVPQNEVVFPYLINANFGAISAGKGYRNPEINIQGPESGLLSCIKRPQTCETGWAWAEIQQLQDNGFVVYGPSSIGTGGYTSLYIYNDVTNYLYDELQRLNETYRNASARRLATITAIEIAKKLQSFNGLSLYTSNTAIKEGVWGTNVNLIRGALRAWKKDHDGVLFSLSDNLDDDLLLETDFTRQPPCHGKPGILHLNFKYRPPVRISRINVGLVPQMFENCDR